MHSKIFTLLSALWLSLTPALCAAGALTHPCDCPTEAVECGNCCESEELGCACIEEGCSHDGCENDPCQVAITPQDDTSKTVLAVTPVLLWAPLCLARDDSLGLPLICDSSSPPGSKKNLPYFCSDLPLRI